MAEQRERVAERAPVEIAARTALRDRALAFSGTAGFATEFVGYETTDQRDDRRGAGERQRPRAGEARRIAVLRDRRWPGGGLRLRRVRRRRLPRARRRRAAPRRRPGRGARARARRRSNRASGCTPTSTAPPATPPSATTPPPISCTPRCGSGSARTSTRPAPTSGPDKLRFDFTHGSALSARRAARRSRTR